jgi:hypothetical protein
MCVHIVRQLKMKRRLSLKAYYKLCPLPTNKQIILPNDKPLVSCLRSTTTPAKRGATWKKVQKSSYSLIKFQWVGSRFKVKRLRCNQDELGLKPERV